MKESNDQLYDKRIAELFPLVKSVALKYCNEAFPLDDLIQEGLIGVIKAVDKFDETYENKFSTYALYWIKKYILDYLNRHSQLSFVEYNDQTTETPFEEEIEEVIALTFPPNFPKLEKEVIIHLYQEDFTLKQVALKIGISRERVRQIREKALRRLKASGFFIEDINH